MAGYKLKNIVQEFLIELGDSSLNRYARAYQLATACLRELNMDLSGVPKISSLAINSNDTVDLPNDYLQYVKIAICGRDGKLHSLGVNNSICLSPSYDDCGNSIKQTSTNETTGEYAIGYEFYSDHFRNGEVMGRFFGVGGGNNSNGEFRIDKKNNQLLLSAVNERITSIVLEYISDISAIDEDYEVHPFLIETIKSWIYWKMISKDRNRNLGEKQLAEKDYWNNYRRSKNRYAAFTIDEFLQTIRTGNMAAPKF